MDMSHPEGASVNGGISPDMSVDHLVEVVYSLGAGSLLAKADIKSALRIIPVHRWSLEWDSKHFVDIALPFGL